MEKQGDRRPRDQVRGEVSRDMREERQESQETAQDARGEEERKRRAVNVGLLGPWFAYLPVILHVIAQADEAGFELRGLLGFASHILGLKASTLPHPVQFVMPK